MGTMGTKALLLLGFVMVGCGGTVPSTDCPDAAMAAGDAGSASDAAPIDAVVGPDASQCDPCASPSVNREICGCDVYQCIDGVAQVVGRICKGDAGLEPDANVCTGGPVATCSPEPCEVHCSPFPCCCAPGEAGVSCFPETP